MKKTLTTILAIFLITLTAIALISCNNDNNDGTLDASNENNGYLHQHEFTEAIVQSQYLKSEATCFSPALYYYSCKCKEMGTNTFEVGSEIHNGDIEVNYSQLNEFYHIKTKTCNSCNKTIENSSVFHVFDTPDGCSSCGYDEKAITHEAGLYITGTTTLKASWSSLVGSGVLTRDGCVTRGRQDELVGDLIIPNSITEIKEGAFAACTELTGVYISNSVKKIETNAFNGCTNLRCVNVPSSIEHIGGWIFYNCSNLTEVKLPAKLEVDSDEIVISYGLFSGCTKLESLAIPEWFRDIPQHLISRCASLTSITIPSGIKEIGPFAFENCIALKEVIYEGTVEEWNAIIKNRLADYDKNTNDYVVYCIDGTIAKDGTITYN